jgi:hypothetical protein
MMDGVVQESEKGTPQGGPLSPLLANIYLYALDEELEKRGLAFCRYADDCAPRVQEQRDDLVLHATAQPMREGPSGPADRSRSQITFGGSGQKPGS